MGFPGNDRTTPFADTGYPASTDSAAKPFESHCLFREFLVRDMSSDSCDQAGSPCLEGLDHLEEQ